MTAPTLTLVDNVSASEYVTISWTNAGKDTDFYKYQIYVQHAGSQQDQLLYETTDGVGPYSIDSYVFAQNEVTNYVPAEVTQDPGDGSLTVTKGALDPITITWDDKYHLIYDADQSGGFNLVLPATTADSFSTEREEEVINLLGRGRKVNRGSNWGVSGTLTVENYGTDSDTIDFERAVVYSRASLGGEWWLIDPFGNVVKIALGEIDVDRVPGVAGNARSSITVPYQEIS